MSEPNGRQMLAWLRRAETIKRKAENLAFDISTVTGVEHSLTDYADNVVHMSEELTWALSYSPPKPSKDIP